VVLGPASLQGEVVRADAHAGGATRGDPTFDAFYVFGSYFLTGEHRPYDLRNGAFVRVHPERNAFSGDGGLGAIEVACRYSSLDLSDAGVNGGELRSGTLALNWYVNPNTRIMLDSIRASVHGGGDVQALTLRFHVDF